MDLELCALCGHWALGLAYAFDADHRQVRLCHDDSRSCYHRWTVYGDRPAPADGIACTTSRLSVNVFGMARPKVKAEPMTIRLSLAAQAEAERRADAKGVPVRIWLEQAMERALVHP